MFENIINLIENNRNFVITSHVNPDGDSIGSEIALFNYLKNLDKNVKIINYSSTPENYRFLDKLQIIEKFEEDKHKDVIQNSDIIFILDTNEYSRIRTMEPFIKQSPAKKVCIDHHLGSNQNGFDYFLSDTDSPATGEILYNLFNKMRANSIDPSIADALYTAIMTDTGSFRFPRTDSETHKIVSELIKAGADPVKLYTEVYDKASIGRLKLLSRFLSNLQLAYEDKVIYGVLLLNDFDETATDVFDTEGFSHYMMSLDSVQIGLIFTETLKGIKVSFRSKGSIYVNEFAKEFRGGGHQNAAGAFIVDSNVEKVKKAVISIAKKYII